MEGPAIEERIGNSPVAPHFSQQIRPDSLNIFFRQLRHPRMASDNSPRHDRRNLAIQRQPTAQVKQLHEVRHAEVRHLVTVRLLWVVGDVRGWRASGHESMARNMDVGVQVLVVIGRRGVLKRLVAADAEKLHVVHAGALETRDAYARSVSGDV